MCVQIRQSLLLIFPHFPSSISSYFNGLPDNFHSKHNSDATDNCHFPHKFHSLLPTGPGVIN